MTHKEKIARVADQLKARNGSSKFLSLKKQGVSHTVPIPKDPKHRDAKIDLSNLNEILEIDAVHKICVAEPGVTFSDLVQKTLTFGLVPHLVPELKTITIGGAVAGCSVESMSYKFGGFHDSCLEYEVITAKGEVFDCTPTQNADVFQMIHGSYGTLGILSKLKFRLMEAKPFVKMNYVTYPTFEDLQKAILNHCEKQDVDFMDAILHAPDKNILCIGTFVDEAPYTSDYTFLNIFYKSTLQRKEDYLTTYDYFFRYDTECHWMMRTLPGMETRLLRFLFGKMLLTSTNLLKWSKRLRPILKLDKRPDVVLDVFIPVHQLEKFYSRYQKEINYYPLWIVPYNRHDYPWINEDYEKEMKDKIFFDIAIYGLQNRERKVNYYKLLEEMTYECFGFKTLISHNSYDRDTFWKVYNRPIYDKIKARTDPQNHFRNLYDKFHF